MIEIDEPPETAACSTCGALVWLWSPRREAWVCFVVQPDRDLLRLHGCRHAQDYATWRDLPHRTERTAEYVEARELLKSKTQDRTDNQEE